MAGPRGRFVYNPAGVKQLARSNRSGRAMEDIADKIARRAQANGGRFTKGYKSMKIRVDGTQGARAGTAHPVAHWDEWGNRYRAPRAPMRRALSSLGLLSKTKVKSK